MPVRPNENSDCRRRCHPVYIAGVSDYLSQGFAYPLIALGVIFFHSGNFDSQFSQICTMSNSGQLTVFYGCMFAGKTTALIDFISNHGVKPHELLVFKPEIDTRASANIITTHDGKKHECMVLNHDTDLNQLVTPFTKLIALDEAQFFDKIIFSELKRHIAKGVNVVAAGLDKDYLGRPFGLMPLLLEHATDKRELNARCAACGEKAAYTYRKQGNKVLVLIGSDNYYEARCESCYKEGMSQSA